MTHARSSAFSLVLALAFGLGIAVLDARAGEVQGAVLLLLVTGAVLGALAPRVAPLSGILLGAGVPLLYCYAQLMHLPTQSNGFAGTLLAMIPALLGALAGATGRRQLDARRVPPPGI